MQQILDAIEYAKNEHINVYNWKETIHKYTVVSFGLGKFFEDTYKRLFKMCSVEYVCDNNTEKHGKYFYGKKCISPDDLVKLNNPFVIVVMGSYSPVRDQLRELNIPCMYISEMHFIEYQKGKCTAWLDKEKKNISKAIGILEDEESVNVFTNIFCNKIYGSLNSFDYENFIIDGDYFETGLFSLTKKEILIDAGAYDGDTIDYFIRITNGIFDKIYSYELNIENYNQLNKNILKYEQKVQNKIATINAGIWNKNEKLKCTAYGDLDGYQIISELNNDCGDICQLLSLDEAIPEDEKVTIIKMDIEGAEYNALLGAKRIIKKYTPKLAICVYHKPEDLWQIPILIKELNSNYKIFIRHHAGNKYKNTFIYTDTVCYAI